MLTRWYDIEREMTALDELHRRMSRVFGDDSRVRRGWTSLTGSWPQANLYDQGSSLTALVMVAGIDEGDINV